MLKVTLFCAMLAAASAVQCYHECSKVISFSGTVSSTVTDYMTDVPAGLKACKADSVKICGEKEVCLVYTASLSGLVTVNGVEADLALGLRGSSCGKKPVDNALPKDMCDKVGEAYSVGIPGSDKFTFSNAEVTCSSPLYCNRACGVKDTDYLKSKTQQCYNHGDMITKFWTGDGGEGDPVNDDPFKNLPQELKSYSAGTVEMCKEGEECYEYDIDGSSRIEAEHLPNLNYGIFGRFKARAQQCLPTATAADAQTTKDMCDAWQVLIKEEIGAVESLKDIVTEIKTTCQTATKCDDDCVDPDHLKTPEKEEKEEEKECDDKNAAYSFGYYSAILLAALYFV